MEPRVLKVTENNALTGDGKLSRVVMITYAVGTHGPFTLQTTQADITSGVALQQMQEFARVIGLLPGSAGGSSVGH